MTMPLQDGINHSPSRFNCGLAGEQGSVPRHRIPQEAIVWGFGATLLLEQGKFFLGARELSTSLLQSSGNSDRGSRLPNESEDSWRRFTSSGKSSKRRCGGGLSSTSTSVAVDRQTLARPDVPGNAIPAPRVDVDASGTVRLDIRSCRDTGLAPVSDVLSADDVVTRQRAHRAKDLDLLSPLVFSRKARRCIHRQQRHDLEEMVLHHIAQAAGRS